MKLSPEDRRAIDAAVRAGRVTRLPPGYAAGLTRIEAITGVIAPPDPDPGFLAKPAVQASAPIPRAITPASAKRPAPIIAVVVSGGSRRPVGRPLGEITAALLAMQVGQSAVFHSDRVLDHIKTAVKRQPERRWSRALTSDGYVVRRVA